MVNLENVLIGTCGWSYKEDWKDVFYPTYVKQSQFLEYYSSIFRTVEIDSSFYHIPSKKTIINWTKNTPDYFKFSAKCYQEVTHKAKLKLPEAKPFILQHFDNFTPMEKKKDISPSNSTPSKLLYRKSL